ncbi:MULTISPECIES: cupin domain-containing protein [Symbiopectobacterium]|uniref:cupin domain-containing protein n=1 Tax=Symbiopectobacterium TaxID=801 RepID=UPI001A255A8E|nr:MULTISPECIES: cupin domain-containing protein [Symbiopectobacterium]MBG6249019.1 hypothetical protein [Candidatus Symbiopectobacterium sp. PLON1]MBT9429178.1 hypothetical protein [Candidatus Symbiopectobacterium endolongispinus]
MENFILNENDFIYLPRGYWHAPEPCNSHSLHISFAFRRRNGVDFMKSLLPFLSEYTPFREDINKQENDEEKKHYIEQLKSPFDHIITTENLDFFLINSGQRKFIRSDISLDKLLMEKYDRR